MPSSNDSSLRDPEKGNTRVKDISIPAAVRQQYERAGRPKGSLRAHLVDLFWKHHIGKEESKSSSRYMTVIVIALAGVVALTGGVSMLLSKYYLKTPSAWESGGHKFRRIEISTLPAPSPVITPHGTATRLPSVDVNTVLHPKSPTARDRELWPGIPGYETAFTFCSRNNLTNLHKPVIPLLSVSLTVDHRQWLQRLLESIDTHIGRILVQIGNEDPAIVGSIMSQLQNALAKNHKYLDCRVEIIHLDRNPGVAPGMNIGLRALEKTSEAQLPWALVVNSDISFHSGTLSKVSKFMSTNLNSDPEFGLAFLELHPDAKWSAYAPTHRLVSRIGVFDENLFPVYYEDNDYAIRVQLSGMKAAMISGAKVGHALDADGSLHYLSGTLVAQRDHSNRAAKKVEPMMKRGIAGAVPYLDMKWGKPNSPTMFKGPFDNAMLTLKAWKIFPARRDYIKTGRGSLAQAMARDADVLNSLKYNTNSSAQPIYHPGSFKSMIASDPTFCAVEDQTCKCQGKVIFGPNFLPDRFNYFPRLSTLEQMRVHKHTEKDVAGSIQCSSNALGDPQFGEPKYCRSGKCNRTIAGHLILFARCITQK